MQQYEYLTVPFVGSTKQRDKTPAVTLANQLNDLINKTAKDGWEFYRVDHVSINIRSGCLLGLLGSITTQMYDVVIFRRPGR